jgi:hypothetical protein
MTLAQHCSMLPFTPQGIKNKSRDQIGKDEIKEEKKWEERNQFRGTIDREREAHVRLPKSDVLEVEVEVHHGRADTGRLPAALVLLRAECPRSSSPAARRGQWRSAWRSLGDRRRHALALPAQRLQVTPRRSCSSTHRRWNCANVSQEVED